MSNKSAGHGLKTYIEHVQLFLSQCLYESDMSLIYLDHQNELIFVYKDMFGKRSLIL